MGRKLSTQYDHGVRPPCSKSEGGERPRNVKILKRGLDHYGLVGSFLVRATRALFVSGPLIQSPGFVLNPSPVSAVSGGLYWWHPSAPPPHGYPYSERPPGRASPMQAIPFPMSPNHQSHHTVLHSPSTPPTPPAAVWSCPHISSPRLLNLTSKQTQQRRVDRPDNENCTHLGELRSFKRRPLLALSDPRPQPGPPKSGQIRKRFTMSRLNSIKHVGGVCINVLKAWNVCLSFNKYIYWTRIWTPLCDWWTFTNAGWARHTNLMVD